MRRVLSNSTCPLLIWLAMFWTACRSPVVPTLKTFSISGVIRSSSDQSPIEAVAVRATGNASDGQWTERITTSDARGTYRVDGLRDTVSVTMTKSGFHQTSSNIEVSQDAILDVTLKKAAPLLLEGGQLILDYMVSGTLGPKDDRCDPQWDRQAPCRHYGFSPTTERDYTFEILFPACGELELHMFSDSRRVVLWSGKRSIVQTVKLTPGDYVLRLMAYYTCDLFEIAVH